MLLPIRSQSVVESLFVADDRMHVGGQELFPAAEAGQFDQHRDSGDFAAEFRELSG